MNFSDMFKRDCKDCIHFNPERLQDKSKHHCLKWLKCSASLGCTDYELKQQNDRNDNTSENKSNEFINAKKGFPRLACLQNGDRFHIDVLAIDTTILWFIFNQNFIPLGVCEKKTPIRKWLPFIKKTHKYIVFEFWDK